MRIYTTFTVLASLAVTLVSASRHGSRRSHTNVNGTKNELFIAKREGGDRFTYYDVRFQELDFILAKELTLMFVDRLVWVPAARQTPLATS